MYGTDDPHYVARKAVQTKQKQPQVPALIEREIAFFMTCKFLLTVHSHIHATGNYWQWSLGIDLGRQRVNELFHPGR